MVYYRTKFKTEGGILALSTKGNPSIICDTMYKLYLFDTEKGSVSYVTRISKKLESAHRYNRTTALYDLSHNSIYLPHKSAIYAGMINNSAYKPFKAMSVSQKRSVEVSEYSGKGSYFVYGDNKGVTRVYETNNYSCIVALMPRPDYVSALAFSSDESLLMSASYDKSVQLYSLLKAEVIKTLTLSTAIESALFCNDDSLLLMCDRNGKVYFTERHEQFDIIDEVTIGSHWVSALCEVRHLNLVVIGDREGCLLLWSVLTKTVVHKLKVSKSGITTLTLHNNSLLVGSIDALVFDIDIDHHLKEFEALVRTENFAEMFELSEENIFLKFHPMYVVVMQKAWEVVLKKIIELIKKGNVESAAALAAPFFSKKEYADQFRQLIEGQESLMEFLKACRNGETAHAYMLVSKHNYLNTLREYEMLERQYEKIFAKCKSLLQESPNNKAKAQELLKPYMKVLAKRRTITALLSKPTLFVDADNLVRQKNFAAFFELAKRNSFLKETALYERCVKLGETLLQRFMEFESQRKFNEALELLNFLAPFNILNYDVIELKRLIEAKIRVSSCIDANEIEGVYTVIAEYPQLFSFDYFVQFHQRFEDLYKEALFDAQKGRPKAVLKIMNEYLNADFLLNKIATLMKIAYLEEICKKKETIGDWKLILMRYILRFGNDTLFNDYMTKLNKEHLFATVESEENKRGYLTYGFVDTLIEQ